MSAPWSRALSNSAIDRRVPWKQLPEFVNDYAARQPEDAVRKMKGTLASTSASVLAGVANNAEAEMRLHAAREVRGRSCSCLPPPRAPHTQTAIWLARLPSL